MQTRTGSFLRNTITNLMWDGAGWNAKGFSDAVSVTPEQLAFIRATWDFTYVRIIGTSVSC